MKLILGRMSCTSMYTYPYYDFFCKSLGIDISWRINREVAKVLGTSITKETRFLGGNRYCGLNDDFYDKGRYGRKNGKNRLSAM